MREARRQRMAAEKKYRVPVGTRLADPYEPGFLRAMRAGFEPVLLDIWGEPYEPDIPVAPEAEVMDAQPDASGTWFVPTVTEVDPRTVAFINGVPVNLDEELMSEEEYEELMDRNHAAMDAVMRGEGKLIPWVKSRG